MATSGGLSCPDSDVRMYDYYGMSGIPHIIWDGVEHQTGSPDTDVDGTAFQAIINDRLTDDAPLSVTITSFRLYGGEPYLNIEIEVFEDIPQFEETYLRMGINENGLSYGGQGYHNVLRVMPDDIPVTVHSAGEVQEVTVPLVIEGEWDLEELWAFAFVQRDSDEYIYNAGSTYVTPFALSAETEGGQAKITDDTYTFGVTEITNIGAAVSHTVDISMDLSELPDGWDAYFTLDGADLTSATVTMAQYESADLTVTIVPGSQGHYGNALLNLHSQSGEMPEVDLPFTAIRSSANILIVGSDSYARYAEDFFGPAIAATGRGYAVWDRSHSTITTADLDAFEAVIWYSGDTGPGLYESDRDEIETYLDRGGYMLFSGQDLAGRTVEYGGSSWLINVLRTFCMTASDGGPLVDGVAGDPISDGLTFDLQGGDGAGNYDDPDVVTAFGSSDQSVAFLAYPGTSRNAATRVTYEDYKTIFLGFGFESINSAADREVLMSRCLEWLIGPVTPVDNSLPQVSTLHQNLPNPFNPQTTIAFNLPDQMAVSLSVFDVSGRLVDVLLDNEIGQMGRNEVIWRGQDASGRALSSGTYFYRLEGRDFSATKRMMLLK